MGITHHNASLTSYRKVRQAVNGAIKLKWDGLKCEPHVALHHKMQMGTCAIARIARTGDQLTGRNMRTFSHLHRTFHQVQVHPHGAVIMQNPDKIAGRISPATGLLVFNFHNDTGA